MSIINCSYQSYTGSAFISGMEEELQLTGLQYNWMTVLFMAGYLM